MDNLFTFFLNQEKTFEETKIKERNIANLLNTISSTDDLEGSTHLTKES